MAARRNHKPIAHVAFSTFLQALEKLKGKLLTDSLTRSACGIHSDSSWNQFVLTLRFLSLVDDRCVPNDRFRELVAASNPETKLKRILKLSYRDVFTADLLQMTPQQLDKRLMRYGPTDWMLQKARSFFLGAAVFSGIPLSQSLARIVRKRGQKRRRRGVVIRAVPELTATHETANRGAASFTIEGITVGVSFPTSLTRAERADLLQRLVKNVVMFKAETPGLAEAEETTMLETNEGPAH